MTDVDPNLIKVCSAEELKPGQTKVLEIANRSIGVFNVGGTFYALANLCPHAGGPLCRGQVTGMAVAEEPYIISWHRSGEIVRCPWHSWEFDIATGKTLANPSRSVRTYKTQVKSGHVYVEIGKS